MQQAHGALFLAPIVPLGLIIGGVAFVLTGGVVGGIIGANSGKVTKSKTAA